MEAFSRYMSTLQKYQNRIFVSDPPGPALLVWSNKQFLPNITGISIVEMEGSTTSGILSSKLQGIISKQVNFVVPVVRIIYQKDMNYMIVDDEKLELADAATKISAILKVNLGSSPAKRPNNPQQIKDPFHTWSREAFDGINVTKSDIDLILLNNEKNAVNAIFEIKRSAAVKVGRWKPYVDPNSANDINNYYMLMSLSNLLKCRMITVHHEQMDDNTTLQGTDGIDVFWYHPLPNSSILNDFASRKDTTTTTPDKLFSL